MHLLDVSVLVTLCDAAHEFHAEASAWFREIQPDGWATCPLTENGLVRIHGLTVAADHNSLSPFLDLGQQRGELRLGLMDIDRLHVPQSIGLVHLLKCHSMRGRPRGAGQADVTSRPSNRKERGRRGTMGLRVD